MPGIAAILFWRNENFEKKRRSNGSGGQNEFSRILLGGNETLFDSRIVRNHRTILNRDLLWWIWVFIDLHIIKRGLVLWSWFVVWTIVEATKERRCCFQIEASRFWHPVDHKSQNETAHSAILKWSYSDFHKILSTCLESCHKSKTGTNQNRILIKIENENTKIENEY